MATERGFIAALVDRLATRRLGFPPETCSYTVQSVRIPVPHGDSHIDLVGDLYQPILKDHGAPAGTILIQCPYGRGVTMALFSARPYAARGYQCLLTSCRGTFGSEGNFDPWRNESDDGQAIVKWMRQQSWYTGSFATLGGSYLGYVQWALLQDPPVDMLAAVIHCAPHDFSQQLWGTGSLALEWITWAENIASQEDTGLLSILKTLNAPRRTRVILGQHPWTESVKSYFNNRAPWISSVVDHPDASDVFYDDMRYGKALERANIPIYLAGGWHDVFLAQTMEQYDRLNRQGTEVALTVGPWSHLQLGIQSRVHQQSFEWLEKHLAKRTVPQRDATVQYCVTGSAEWRGIQKWPPPSLAQVFYLQADGHLADDKPTTGSESSVFTLDLTRPTPTTGGNLLLGGGSADDTALTLRSDVLNFDTKALDDDVEIAGKIVVELSYCSDRANVDLFVRVSEVNNRGKSNSITETYKRVPSSPKAEQVTLHLNDCAHRFKKGNQIRLLIAGASYPQFAVNIQQWSDAVSGNLQQVKYTIFHSSHVSSMVSLPVVA